MRLLLVTNQELKFIIPTDIHFNVYLQSDNYTADLFALQYFFDFFWKTF